MQKVNLTQHFLIAMPNMVDPHFAKTLTFVCEHNEQGALGVVVNRPIDMTLQTPLGEWQSTLAVNSEVGLTTSKDILQAVARGEGPKQILVTLGYAGWAPGQLEHELSQNAWLTVHAKPEVIFELPSEERLPAAMSLLGVDYARLSEQAGHA
jgi:putative transcriptional regulator